jgi:sterol desaturase/sphingolipid hydroxylase (fatty acid hydroxylase superfamily)
MIHHYTDPDNGYGVSSKFWDHIYRTTFTKKAGCPVIVEEVKEELVEEDHS